MPIRLSKNIAVLEGHCTREDARTLLPFLRVQSGAQVSLKGATLLDSAVVQVVLAADSVVCDAPVSGPLATLLWPALKRHLRSSGFEASQERAADERQ